MTPPQTSAIICGHRIATYMYQQQTNKHKLNYRAFSKSIAQSKYSTDDTSLFIPIAKLDLLIIVNRMKKIHEIWPGHNRFFCSCCIAGPGRDLAGLIYIHVYSLVIIIPFCVFIVGETWNVTPALPIILLLSICSMYLFLYLTACSDPGIIPRRPFLETDSQKYQKYLVPPNQFTKVCQTCHIYRPKRTSHCSSCQNCVQIYDHHCGFVGTCIAKRNYRYFIMFLASILLSTVMLLINLIVYFLYRSSGSINQTAVIVVVVVVAAIIGIPILAFFIFHLYLAVTGNTTREVLKKLDKDQKGDVQNQWCNVDPSHIDFFADISEQQAALITSQLQELARPLAQQSFHNQQHPPALP